MRLLCRKICDSDLESVVDLLVSGFPIRRRKYWADGFARLLARPPVNDFPKYGYLLESDGEVVGVVLMIFSECSTSSGYYIRCNMSSWHVTPKFQGYASLMVSSAVRSRNVTYVNASPAPHTWPIIETQGFRRYCDGQFIAIPALSKPVAGARIARFDLCRKEARALSDAERSIMVDHVKQGCIALTCAHEGNIHPFVFIPRTLMRGKISCLHLGYCRNTNEFVKFAGPLGRALVGKGRLLVVIDSNGPIPGLAGRYFADLGPKYYKGPIKPRLGDLTYTEGVFFH